LRILEIDGIKTVPNVPLSRPFVERLIGTMRREFLDQVLFWNARDLERKLAEFQAYYNTARSHASLEGLQRWIEHGTEDFRTVVTERSNAATEERLKSGHAVGGVSIV
jgi:transposase InsO family protein